MNLLYVTPDGFDTPTPNNQLVETLLVDMLDDGICVYAVTGRKTGQREDVPASLRNREGFSIEVVERGIVDKTNLFRRWFYDLKYVFTAAHFWLRWKSKVDVALVQSCPLGVFHAVLLKLLLGVPVAYNTYEIFPGSAHSIGVIQNGVIYKALEALQRLLYRTCDLFVTVSEDMAKTLEKKGVSRSKISIVPNWFNDADVTEVENESNRFIKAYDIPIKERFIVQFAGTIGYVFDYQLVIQIAQRLVDLPSVEFHIIGKGTRADEFKRAVKEAKLNSIKFFPWQPIEIIADVYSACAVGLIPLERGVIFNGYPSKSSLLMACGRPVIYSLEEESSFASIINSNFVGIAVASGDVDAIADAIRSLYNDTNLAQEIGDNAKRYAYAHLGRARNTASFIKALNNLVRGEIS